MTHFTDCLGRLPDNRFAMTETREETHKRIVDELCKLLDEQMETLRRKIDPEEVLSYAHRKRRIDALVAMLGGDSPKAQ